MRKAHVLAFCLVPGLLAFSLQVLAITSDDLLTNPGFGSDLSGWRFNAAYVEWANKDANGSPASGSAHVTTSATNGASTAVSACVALPSAGPFDVGGRFFLPSGQGQAVGATVLLEWFSNPSCSSPSLDESFFETPVPSPTDSWTLVAGYRQTPPAGAVAALALFSIDKLDSPAGPTVDGYVDDAFFRPTSCTPTDTDLCLNGGRFRATVQWESPTDGGVGHGVQFNDESGYFWFFGPENTEVVLKVHNACVDPFNRYWVFAAGLTNVLVTLHVEDTATGAVNEYINPGGTAFFPLQDTQAFATCP